MELPNSFYSGIPVVESQYKDFLGNRLETGDKIVFMEVGYRNLVEGTIKKLSPKKATIEYRNKQTTVQFYNQIVKIG